jgi:hypothetical protein
MRIPAAPSWPTVIASGLAGGIMNGLMDANGVPGGDLAGIAAFALLTSLALVFRRSHSS